MARVERKPYLTGTSTAKLLLEIEEFESWMVTQIERNDMALVDSTLVIFYEIFDELAARRALGIPGY